ncbi:MAG TPA: hypothetical protein V6C81_10480 [Planktothrix sp.]
MITDKPPRKIADKEEYARSDAMKSLLLPAEVRLQQCAKEIELLLKCEDRKKIETASNELGAIVAACYGVKCPTVKVLGVRPLEENGDRVDELFGDYDFDSQRIRLWMRTAVLEKATSYGTFLSTLCHELCHHLDVVHFGFPHTFHTCGFYERAGLLYHHARSTPARQLVWEKQSNGTHRINWPMTMRGPAKPISSDLLASK